MVGMKHPLRQSNGAKAANARAGATDLQSDLLFKLAPFVRFAVAPGSSERPAWRGRLTREICSGSAIPPLWQNVDITSIEKNEPSASPHLEPAAAEFICAVINSFFPEECLLLCAACGDVST